MSLDVLRRVPLFAELPAADLEALHRRAEITDLPCGEWLMREGDAGDSLYVVLDGSIEITKRSGEQQVVLAVRGAGEVIGEMALMESKPRFASGRALQDSRLLRIGMEAFRHLLSTSPSAPLALLQTINTRLRSTEGMLRQSEKMAALGTLAAGLAHELNNPAAAVRRSASQLGEALVEWERLASDLGGLALDGEQLEAVRALRQDIAARAGSPPELDPMARADLESSLQDWLEAEGAPEPWMLAPTLASFGWKVADLNRVGQRFQGESLFTVVRWMAAGSSAQALLSELAMGAERISEIVTAVKAYTYLDQAPIQDVDLHEGLHNTLVMLRHKLAAGVHVAREFAPDLPRIEAYGSGLNQVWTNIIDNAIDAMEGQGEVVLRTSWQDDRVTVEIADNGPGIEPGIQSRIFEPFFTTKPPGAGTGLGLHIAYNIVQRHGGQLAVTSRPGATSFTVTLPTRLPRG